MARRAFLFVFTILLFSSISNTNSTHNYSAEASNTQVPILTDSIFHDFEELPELDIVNTSAFNLNVKFLGFNDTLVNMSVLDEYLINWHAPIDRYPEIYRGNPDEGIDFDVNFTLNYDFDFLDENEVELYRDFLKNNSTTNQVGWYWPFYLDLVANRNTTESAMYIRSENAENYLMNNYAGPDNHTIIIINTYTGYEDGFVPYYYNMSFTDLDNPDFTPRRYSSTNQIAGGGSHSNLLYVDYSAGPEGYTRQYQNHILDYDLTSSEDLNRLNIDIANDIRTAIEFKMLPSYIYPPVVPKKEVKFEFLLLNFEDAATIPALSDVPTSNYDYFDALDPARVVADFVQVNPWVDWTYEILGEWDWLSVPNMNETMISAINTTSEYIGYSVIMDQLDTHYPSLFSESNDTHRVIPVFLWGMPDRYSTGFGGVATGDANGEFTYLISARSRVIAQGEQYSLPWIDTVNVTDTQPGEPSVYFYRQGYFDGEIYETLLDVTEGENVSIEVLDMVNYAKWKKNDPYDALHSFTNLNVTNQLAPFNISAGPIYDYYVWIITNEGLINTSFTMDITGYRTLKIGTTRVTIHEGGHGIGVSHPHDGFSWSKVEDNSTYYGEYQDWLWDSSYTTMTYAAAIPGLSGMDVAAIQRSFLYDYYKEIVTSMIHLQNSTANIHDYVPNEIYENLMQINSLYNESVEAFHTMEYMSAVEGAMQMFTLIEDTQDLIDNSLITMEIEFRGLDHIPSGQKIWYNISILGQTNIINETSTNKILSVPNIPWTNIQVWVLYNNTLIGQFEGYTWETIVFDFSVNFPKPQTTLTTSSEVTTSTSTIGSTTTSDTSHSEKTSSSTSPSDTEISSSATLPVMTAIILVMLLTFPLIRRRS